MGLDGNEQFKPPDMGENHVWLGAPPCLIVQVLYTMSGSITASYSIAIPIHWVLSPSLWPGKLTKPLQMLSKLTWKNKSERATKAEQGQVICKHECH